MASSPALSCFFCQNLLSDFIEDLLPANRHEEVKSHLSSCGECSALRRDLSDTIGIVRKLPHCSLNGETLSKIQKAQLSGIHLKSRAKISQWAMVSSVPVLASIVFFMLFPHLFPWKDLLNASDDESQFVRFFPLMHGAADFVDEQVSWLHGKTWEGGSLWEEGGISPDEFERAFEPSRRDPTP